MLGVGNIIKDQRSSVIFQIKNRVHLYDIIQPIFDKYGMYTSKESNYILFKECLNIYTDTFMKREEKDTKIINLLKSKDFLS
jgi:hypothetical protein